jgi:benzodiazapine receptor
MNKKFILLLSSILLCLSAGFLGSIFTAPSIPTWYAALNKPAFNPPSWIFAPVWTFLYILMGISLYLILVNKKKNKKLAIKLFLAQLILNSLWSILFFGAHSLYLAFLEIILLWLTIFATIYEFRKIEPNAAWLLIPYLIWVTFASYLNFTIWQLNL